jgi:nucleotide-binding universal stress UspA family protein
VFKKLLIPLDRSSLAEQAIGQAAAIARAAHAEVDVVLVHQPLPFAGFNDEPWNEQQWNNDHKYVETIANDVTSGARVPVTHNVARGEAIDMICKRAWDIQADLIVMTSHGRTGLSRAWLGSVASGVIRHSAIPVLVLRPVATKDDAAAAHHLFKHILVPYDGSALGAEILEGALALAECSAARVTLLRVVEPVPMAMAIGVDMGPVYPPFIPDEVATNRLAETAAEQLDDVARRVFEKGSVAVEAEVVVAPGVAQAIIDFARGHSVDAIAMSTHGRGASRLFFGSVADKVLRASGLPMLMHRPLGVSHNHVVSEPATAAEPSYVI